MVKRVYFAIIVLFWLTMMVLLWRAEIGSLHGIGGTPVPPRLVWTRILTAPDDSPLEVFREKERIGHCRWWANVLENHDTDAVPSSVEQIEGRVRRVTGYTLDLEGNIVLGAAQPRFRFAWHAEFNRDEKWRNMTLKLAFRPTTIEVKADAETQTIAISSDDGQSTWQRKFTFAELAQPNVILRNLGLAYASFFFDGLPLIGQTQVANLDPGIQWDARSDWLEAGNARVRIYKLQARLFDKYKTVVYTSRVGEILKAELPGDIVLMNEALFQLSNFHQREK